MVIATVVVGFLAALIGGPSLIDHVAKTQAEQVNSANLRTAP